MHSNTNKRFATDKMTTINAMHKYCAKKNQDEK